MRRREALQQVGLVVSLASTSGCAAILGGRGNNKDDGDSVRSGHLESLGLRPTKGKNGNLVVVVTVKNKGKKKESTDLRVTVSSNGAVHERTPTISVSAGETKDIKVSFEMSYEKYSSAKSSISIDLK